MLKFLLGALAMAAVIYFWRRGEGSRPDDFAMPPRPVRVSSTVERLVREGRKIDAIKAYREEHRCGLKEAKDAVESIEKTLR